MFRKRSFAYEKKKKSEREEERAKKERKVRQGKGAGWLARRHKSLLAICLNKPSISVPSSDKDKEMQPGTKEMEPGTKGMEPANKDTRVTGGKK